jgi:uncharacterized YceG family protein
MAFSGRRDSSERTAEDRAKAAAERAARRAQREGRSVPPPPQETFEREVPPPEYRDASPPEPFPEPEPEPAPEPVAARVDPAPAYDAGRHDAEPEPETDPRGLIAVQDRPPPPRRVPASRRTARRPAPRPVRAPRSRAPRRPEGRPWGRRIAAIAALLAFAGVLYVAYATFQPFHGDATGRVAVEIPEGANAGRIGEILEQRGVVESATFFNLNATVTGRRGGLRPGRYTLRENMTYGAVIEALSEGPRAKVVPTVDVTIPEGPSIRETSPLVAETSLRGNYRRAAGERRVLRRVRRLGAPRGTDTAEGFLFPSTYTLVDGAPVRNLVTRQLDAFEENFRGIDMAYAKRRNLTRYDVLIIASMVEREAQLDRERPLIASVIYNRLSEGMPLGIDATIRYHINNWSRPIRQSELDEDSPYNSRLNTGLPPTPIGNPGLKSIEAAARPARTDYLFFVVKPGGEGEHAFSSTDAEFQRDYERYQASRGGP